MFAYFPVWWLVVCSYQRQEVSRENRKWRFELIEEGKCFNNNNNIGTKKMEHRSRATPSTPSPPILTTCCSYVTLRETERGRAHQLWITTQCHWMFVDIVNIVSKTTTTTCGYQNTRTYALYPQNKLCTVKRWNSKYARNGAWMRKTGKAVYFAMFWGLCCYALVFSIIRTYSTFFRYFLKAADNGHV